MGILVYILVNIILQVFEFQWSITVFDFLSYKLYIFLYLCFAVLFTKWLFICWFWIQSLTQIFGLGCAQIHAFLDQWLHHSNYFRFRYCVWKLSKLSMIAAIFTHKQCTDPFWRRVWRRQLVSCLRLPDLASPDIGTGPRKPLYFLAFCNDFVYGNPVPTSSASAFEHFFIRTSGTECICSSKILYRICIWRRRIRTHGTEYLHICQHFVLIMYKEPLIFSFSPPFIFVPHYFCAGGMARPLYIHITCFTWFTHLYST